MLEHPKDFYAEDFEEVVSRLYHKDMSRKQVEVHKLLTHCERRQRDLVEMELGGRGGPHAVALTVAKEMRSAKRSSKEEIQRKKAQLMREEHGRMVALNTWLEGAL